jgi:hypothetical protein
MFVGTVTRVLTRVSVFLSMLSILPLIFLTYLNTYLHTYLLPSLLAFFHDCVYRIFIYLAELMRGQNLSHSQRNVLFELAGNIQIHEVRTRLTFP